MKHPHDWVQAVFYGCIAFLILLMVAIPLGWVKRKVPPETVCVAYTTEMQWLPGSLGIGMQVGTMRFVPVTKCMGWKPNPDYAKYLEEKDEIHE